MLEKFFRQEILDNQLYHVDYCEGVKLNQNECPWDVPIDLKVRITERLIKTDWNRYPVDDLIHLQTKIANQTEGIRPNQIVLSNGSNTIIQALIQVILPHSKVLILDPSFVVYELQAKLLGHRIVKVPLSENFELQIEKTLTAIKKEKPGIIFIANPNAPTGTLFDKQSLYKIIQTANCPVVIDEAYYPFTDETAVDWLNDFQNLIIMRTFSKALALAGVRCGYIIANPDISMQVEKMLMSFRLSKITCVIVDEILDHHSYLKEYVSNILKERGRLFSKMQKMNGLQVFPSEANFLLFRVENSTKVNKKLMEQRVLIRHVSQPGPLKNCLRVTVGTAEENDQFLNALSSSL